MADGTHITPVLPEAQRCPVLDILTLPETLAALIATAGAIVCVVAWYCWNG